MPNRILKDSIRTSKSINALSDFQFRLWAYLITYVDDFGRGRAETDILKGYVFPRRKSVTEANIQSALSEMACMGLIQLYEVDGDSYLCFPNWQKHQSVRAAKSKFPGPEDACNQVHSNEIKCNQVYADSPVFDNRESLFDNRESIGRKRSQSRFTPPTVEEVQAYANEKGWNNFDAQRFVDFYASKGWLVGKSPMKDFKAAMRNWQSRNAQPQGKHDGWHNPAQDYQQREYKADDYGDDFFYDATKEYGGTT